MAVSLSPDTIRTRRCTVEIEGVVQGIGFRPFVFRVATRHGLVGEIRNSLQGASVEVEGAEDCIQRFLDELAHVRGPGVPPRLTIHWDRARGAGPSFRIADSACDGPARVSPTPDLATCTACRHELSDSRDRRHGYALLTCAACGPRFTMISALPYDRARTTMREFALCQSCRAEYDDPDDRRFHAEGIACATCGPRLTLYGTDGSTIATPEPIRHAAAALRGGGIVAIKGVGGYHLACDATSGAAVAELRRRKRREARPLAVMVAHLTAARRLAAISDVEAELLSSPARPIVLVRRLGATAVADDVAPGCAELGLVLPYTGLHHRLLEDLARPLVMTSGNVSDETIAYRDDDARQRLGGLADLVLTHDRTIETPCDDSVARVVSGRPQLVRRSRGYVPLAVRLPVPAPRAVLACGAELKHTFALVREDQAFLSQHLGDMASESTFREFRRAIGHLESLLGLAPDVVAHDLHPGYRSTRYACSLDEVERIPVQHHHAHIASCLADNGVDRRVIGVAWDGAGHGLDGQVWGGEFLVADLAGFERAGHFEPVPLPGGDAASREPWRMAAVFLRAAYGETMTDLDLAFVHRLDRAAWRVLARAAEQGLNAPLTSSAGRLFDAVASLLGIRDRAGYEAQAAMELEALAESQADRVYDVRLDEASSVLVVRTPDVVRGVVEDLLAEVPAARIAARFHGTLADVLTRTCERIRARSGLTAVALSGGVFQNVWLLTAAAKRLGEAGFEIYRHQQVPANDGGLSLGQAAVAARRLADRR